MLYGKELKAALQPHFTWHGARLTFLSWFGIALFKVRTAHLADLCLGFEGNAKTSSSLKRLSRFFWQFEVKDEEIAPHEPKTKSIFRTGLDHLRHLLLNPSPAHRLAFRESLSFPGT
jgi:hypothetical protein